jgi:hypothetical protein
VQRTRGCSVEQPVLCTRSIARSYHRRRAGLAGATRGCLVAGMVREVGKGCKIGGDFRIIPAAQSTLDGRDGPRGGRYLKYRPPPGSPSAARRSAAPCTLPPGEPSAAATACVYHGLRLSLGSAELRVCARHLWPRRT